MGRDLCADPKFKPLCPKCDADRVEAYSHLFGLMQGYQCKACGFTFSGYYDDNFSSWKWCSSCKRAVDIAGEDGYCRATSDHKHTLERRRWRTKEEVW